MKCSVILYDNGSIKFYSRNSNTRYIKLIGIIHLQADLIYCA